MDIINSPSSEVSLSWVLDSLHSGATESLTVALASLHPADIANLLEAMPPEERELLWEQVEPSIEGEVLAYLHDEARASIIEEMDDAELLAATEQMDVEDLATVLEELPSDVSGTLLESLDQDRRARLQTVLAYDDGTAGRIMSVDLLSVRPDVSLAVVLRWLRLHESLPAHTDAIMVVDEQGAYKGKLSLEMIVTRSADLLVEAVMDTASETVLVSTTEHEIAALFERRDLISVAVVDEQRKLLGRITVDDVVDIIREEAEHSLMRSAGLDEEEDLFAPVIPSAQRRGVWLGINLVTVFMAAWVIGQFSEALDQIVALAVLMPVVASMGGIAGSQTLTLTIRGMALDQIAAGNTRWLLMKEVSVGALNGSVWAIVVALVSYIWFSSIGLSLIIGVALVLNLLAAALAGILVPLTLKKMGIDPALSGAVILTTVTDIIGFLSFLGLASLFLL